MKVGRCFHFPARNLPECCQIHPCIVSSPYWKMSDQLYASEWLSSHLHLSPCHRTPRRGKVQCLLGDIGSLFSAETRQETALFQLSQVGELPVLFKKNWNKKNPLLSKHLTVCPQMHFPPRFAYVKMLAQSAGHHNSLCALFLFCIIFQKALNVCCVRYILTSRSGLPRNSSGGSL